MGLLYSLSQQRCACRNELLHSGSASSVTVQIALVDESQAGEGQHFVYRLDVLRSAGDEFGEAARSNGLRVRSHFSDHAFQDAVDKPDIAVVETDLDVVDGSGTDDLRGFF